MAPRTFWLDENVLKLKCTDGCTINTFSKVIVLYTSMRNFVVYKWQSSNDAKKWKVSNLMGQWAKLYGTNIKRHLGILFPQRNS